MLSSLQKSVSGYKVYLSSLVSHYIPRQVYNDSYWKPVCWVHCQRREMKSPCSMLYHFWGVLLLLLLLLLLFFFRHAPDTCKYCRHRLRKKLSMKNGVSSKLMTNNLTLCSRKATVKLYFICRIIQYCIWILHSRVIYIVIWETAALNLETVNKIQ